jgi:hypothetical protein
MIRVEITTSFNLDALELRYNTHSLLLFYSKIGVIIYDRKRSRYREGKMFIDAKQTKKNR